MEKTVQPSKEMRARYKVVTKDQKVFYSIWEENVDHDLIRGMREATNSIMTMEHLRIVLDTDEQGGHYEEVSFNCGDISRISIQVDNWYDEED